MPPPLNPSILQERGVGIRKRAESMALHAHPFAKNQIATVAAAARDALAWLQDPTPENMRDRIVLIDASLQAQAKRLDELEELLAQRGSGASGA